MATAIDQIARSRSGFVGYRPSLRGWLVAFAVLIGLIPALVIMDGGRPSATGLSQSASPARDPAPGRPDASTSISSFTREFPSAPSVEEIDVVKMGRSLRGSDLIYVDDSPSRFLCTPDKDLCMSGIDAGNYKTGCIVGEANGCRLILNAMAMECGIGYPGVCEALQALSPSGSEFREFGRSCGGRAPAGAAGKCPTYDRSE